jgi:hypothetical protein
MIIREASLCLRFYTADGWTRSDVAELLKPIPTDMIGYCIKIPMFFVCPRWFDDKEKDGRYGGYQYATFEQHLDCAYYAVYIVDVRSETQFDEEKLKQHTIIPFGSVAI